MPSDLEGTRLALVNRYRLDVPIARGGMGTVWRAEDTLLRRPVAVKEIAIPGGTPGDEEGLRRRVMREAQAAARLSHPRTVTVYDVVEQDDRIWLVMELVEGGSLADVVRTNGRLTPQRAAAVGVGLAAALAEAHRRGIIHRDVKPGNVLVMPDGAVKLADFGIASVRDDPRITHTGMVLGSPSFMAPEQARGEEVTPAVDVWGLGATLWYSVEGRSPFHRDTAMATLGAIVNEPIPPATSAGPLGPVLDRLLDKDPARRPTLDEAERLLTSVAAQHDADVTTALAPMAAATAAAGTAPAPAPSVTTTSPVVPVPAGRPVRTRTGPPSGRGGGWGWLAALLTALVLLGGGLLLARALGDDGGTDEAAEPSASTTTSAPATSTTAAPTTTAPPSTTATTAAPTTTAPQPTTTAAPPASLPEGWVPYQHDATGFVIGHPGGWEVENAGANRIRFRDPSTGDNLLVEWTDDPGPSALGAWQEQAPHFASTHDGYQEIRLEQVEYKGLDAAVWEFTWVDDGTTLHGHDLGMVAGDYGFALFSVAADSRWAEASPTFDLMAQTFTPPGV